MAKLSAAARKKIPSSQFGLPSKAQTPSGKAASGSYPMPDKSHAANAKSRAAQSTKLSAAQKAQINAKANKILGKSAGKSKGK